jgi:alkanesulfonate monooxygenase SsuD/methylene tetrahydromethanopterin reductase-like flavin-dependent oxidoreductase (luciferase family)
MFPPWGLLDRGVDAARDYLARVGEAGIDHVCCGDHVSFGGGHGSDGLLQATALTMLHPTLPVHTGVYLLPLRHPVPVARQLADLARLAPGRLVFGVGVGGEDRHEIEVCGVDPATRGRRMDESLTVLRELLTGHPVTLRGEFFDLTDAVVLPAPSTPIPIVIGGRSDAAIRRATELGDGWLGIWNSPNRFAAAADLAGPGRHAMQVWCGFADTGAVARSSVAQAMQQVYGMPFEKFERYCPYGTPEDVAEFLAPYVAAGCTEFNLIPQAPDDDEALAGVAAVRKLLS